jgi:hypothetical protein
MPLFRDWKDSITSKHIVDEMQHLVLLLPLHIGIAIARREARAFVVFVDGAT